MIEPDPDGHAPPAVGYVSQVKASACRALPSPALIREQVLLRERAFA